MTSSITTLVASQGDWDHAWWPLWALFWLALVLTVVWLVARRRPHPERSGIDRARDILAERFARGELTADEYRERLDQLR